MSGGPDVIIIKKKPKHAGAHGAAWKVAYADFVTAMMALFMVLWLVSQTDQKLKKSLSDYFRTGVFSGAPSLLEGGSGLADRGFVDVNSQEEPSITPIMLERDAETVRGAINQAVNSPDLKDLADMITVKVTESGILIQIAEGRDDLLFDLSSSDLKPELVKLIGDVAPTLAHLGYALELHGHTDGRPFPTGSVKNNWTLSFQRAENARMELVRNGVPPGLIAGVYAHGDTQPVVKDPKSPMNRRLAIFARRIAPAKSDDKAKGDGEKGPAEKAAPEKGAAEKGTTGERSTGKKGSQHASAKEPSDDEETASEDEPASAGRRTPHH